MAKESAFVVGTVIMSTIEGFDSDESSEDEDVLLYHYLKYRRHIGPPQKKVRVANYLENVVHLYTEAEFKSHFRMNRRTFDSVLNLLGPTLQKQNTMDGYKGRQPIEPQKQLLICIWYLATPDSYRSICDKFDVGKASALQAVRRVLKAILHFKSQFIKWPSPDECHHIMEAFEGRFGFPGVVGCVDGTHIKIPAPKENPNDYINRKGFHSIQLQVTCDNERKFMHCYCGHPGSMHDQRVFRLSGLQELCSDDNNFPNNSHLLGDAAYSLHQHLLVPYRDNGRLTNRQQYFNTRLSQTRMTVERSLALLKGRFRRLLDKLDVKRTDLIPYYILACCVLHNICIGLNDDFDAPIIIDVDEERERVVLQPRNERANREALEKRDRIADHLRI